MRLSFRYSAWSLVSVSTRRSSTAVGLAAARGRLTSMPRYIIGAVSMKISSSTSTTSTSGMMLISASDVPMRRSPSGAPALNAIFRRASQLRHLQPGGAAHRPVHRVEPLGRQPLVALVDHVVDDVGHAGDLGVGGGVELGQRAVAVLPRRRLHQRRPAPLAEDLHEPQRLPP